MGGPLASPAGACRCRSGACACTLPLAQLPTLLPMPLLLLALLPLPLLLLLLLLLLYLLSLPLLLPLLLLLLLLPLLLGVLVGLQGQCDIIRVIIALSTHHALLQLPGVSWNAESRVRERALCVVQATVQASVLALLELPGRAAGQQAQCMSWLCGWVRLKRHGYGMRGRAIRKAQRTYRM